MSIQEEILRITDDRDRMRTHLKGFGLVQDTADLDDITLAVESIDNKGAVSIEVLEGDSYTIPKGYHNGSGIVKAMTDTAGDRERYKTQAKTVTPTKSQQNVTSDQGYYALESVTVEAIPANYADISSVDAAAEDVLANKVFVGSNGKLTAGAMPNNGAVSKTLDTTTKSYTVPEGYHDGNGTVQIVTEIAAAIPSKERQEIKPAAGKVFNMAVVAAIPAAYQDVTEVNVPETMVADGFKFVNKNGEVVEGTMPIHEGVGTTLSTTKTSHLIEAGYHDGNGDVHIILEEKTETPTKSTKTVTPTSGKVLSKVTVNPIPDAYQDVTPVTATADKVLEGSKFVDAEGNVVDGTMVDHSDDNGLVWAPNGSYITVEAGYYPYAIESSTPSGVLAEPHVYVDPSTGLITASSTIEEPGYLGTDAAYSEYQLAVQPSKTITPTKSEQTAVGAHLYTTGVVKVAPIPDEYQDISGVTAAGNDVLEGKLFVNADGELIDGSMPNNGSVSSSIDGLSTTSAEIPAGYTTGGTVSLTDDIENALKAI